MALHTERRGLAALVEESSEKSSITAAGKKKLWYCGKRQPVPVEGSAEAE